MTTLSSHTKTPMPARHQLCDRNDEVVIMSYNIKALFPFYNARRIANIVAFIQDQFTNNKVDIICLQEAFELELYDQLYSMASRNRLNIVHPPLKRKWVVGENSGLATISRYPILEGDSFTAFAKSSGLCAFANKGYHYLEVCLGGDDMLPIVNTHLQSDNVAIAMDQFLSIDVERAIIVGDLNMDHDLVSTLCDPVNPEKMTTFCDQRQLDYFVLRGMALDCSFEVLTDVGHSDHWPIMGRFMKGKN